MHLGTISPAPRVVEPITFDWYGETGISTSEGLSDLLLVDFLNQFGDLDIDNPLTAIHAMGAMKDFTRSLIAPEDFDRFWLESQRHGDIRAILGLTRSLIEAITARPTEPSSVSTDGRSTVPTSSAATPEWIAASALPGRPDLQAAAVAAQRSV